MTQKWDGTWYDYQGECDLVLLAASKQGSDWGNTFGKGLRIHVRTTLRYGYSFIEAVALSIGDSLMEVASWGQLYLDGISLDPQQDDLFTTAKAQFAGYPLTYHTDGRKTHAFVIQIDDHNNITLNTFKDFVNVHVHTNRLGGSVGLMGDFKTGQSLGRDGVTVLQDPDVFGQEWQVLDSEPKLFLVSRSPQLPHEKCRLPQNQTVAHKPLDMVDDLDSSFLRQAAEKACREWAQQQNLEACMLDVMVTGDLDVVQAGEAF